jgi:hypothetical protein
MNLATVMSAALLGNLTARQREALASCVRHGSLHRIRRGWTTGCGEAEVWPSGTIEALMSRDLLRQDWFNMVPTDLGRTVAAEIEARKC